MQPQQPQERPPTSDPYPQQPTSPSAPAAPTPPANPYEQAKPQLTNSPDYDFIFNPNQPKPKAALPINGFSGSSALAKAGLVAGGLAVLLILFLLARAIFGGGPDLTPFVTVAQEQQALVKLTTDALQQPELSTANKNFAATAKLSLGSSQSETIKYLNQNGQKLDQTQLNLKINPKTDEQMKAAQTTGTYNQTFQTVMKEKLGAYSNDLKQAFNQTSGVNGRTLLNKDYEQAQLLLSQLETPVQ